jgi:hypothetical protein
MFVKKVSKKSKSRILARFENKVINITNIYV